MVQAEILEAVQQEAVWADSAGAQAVNGVAKVPQEPGEDTPGAEVRLQV